MFFFFVVVAYAAGTSYTFFKVWFAVSARRCVAVISVCLTAPPLEITALAVDWAEQALCQFLVFYRS